MLSLENVLGGWSAFHAPAVNTQATIARAAAGARARNVCTAIAAKLIGGTTAPAAVQVTLHLRDGATGAGTPLVSYTMVLPAAVGGKDEYILSGLNIIGTPNTAMTLEFSAAGGANSFESVHMTGYTIQG